MIKDIIVNLPLNAERDVTTAFAATVAGYFDAHLTGIGFAYEPILPAVELGISIPAAYIDQQEIEAKRNAEAAVERFKLEIRRDELSFATHVLLASSADAPGRFAEIARGFDLAIVSQPSADTGTIDDLIAEATLFESGRPTLIVPYIQRSSFKADRVAICWDGSRAATRAIADAMPFLQRAHTIDLVSAFGDRLLRAELEGADMVRHLSRHGLEVNLKKILNGSDVAAMILNFVSDADIDLLVMGGYGHSRFREFVLGGVTRTILASMTVPTLMSH